LRGGRRVKVIKIQMRLARLSNRLTIDRNVIGAINIGLRYLKSDGKGYDAPLNRASGGAGEAGDPTPRANPPHRIRNTVRGETLLH
jgi:hypothetical protein